MSNVETNSQPKQRRPGGRTSDVTRRLFAATLAILEEQGYGALAFVDVAERSGVARTTIYRRWTSRAALALDAIESSVADNIDMHDTGSFAGDLTNALTQIGRFIESPGGRAAILASFEMAGGPEADERASLWLHRRDQVVGLYDRAVARGEIDDTVDPDLAFSRVAGSIYFRAIVMGSPITPEWIDAVVRDATIGINPPKA